MMTTQCDVLLAALQRGERLTVAVALSQYGVYALSQRMGDLRKLGWHVLDRWVETSSGARVKEYRLEEKVFA